MLCPKWVVIQTLKLRFAGIAGIGSLTFERMKYRFLFQFASRMELGNLCLKTVSSESTQVMEFNVILCSLSSFDKSKIIRPDTTYGRNTFLIMHVVHRYFCVLLMPLCSFIESVMSVFLSGDIC